MKTELSYPDPFQQFVDRRRQRFVATFDAQCEFIRKLIDNVSSCKLRGPAGSLRRAAHRLSGLARTIGLSMTSARASELENLAVRAHQGAFDAALARAVVDALPEALNQDLSCTLAAAAAELPADAPAPAPPMRVLIVDDHALLRCGLRALLSSQFVGATFGEACDANAALAQLRKQAWDVALIDITLPGKSGLDLLKELKAEWPSLPVLVLSGHAEDHFALRALKAGAGGYITKETAPEELVRAVSKILTGGRYVSRELAEKLAVDTQKDSTCAPHETLSDREYEVMSQIAAGKTVTEIAGRLSLSVKTISTYRARILEKLDVRNNAEIVQYALRNALVG
jgi:two-component system invasion response regulator UvrY